MDAIFKFVNVRTLLFILCMFYDALFQNNLDKNTLFVYFYLEKCYIL